MLPVSLDNLIIYVANFEIFSLILLVGYSNHIVVHFTENSYRNIIRSYFPSVVHNGINLFVRYFSSSLVNTDGY